MKDEKGPTLGGEEDTASRGKSHSNPEAGAHRECSWNREASEAEGRERRRVEMGVQRGRGKVTSALSSTLSKESGTSSECTEEFKQRRDVFEFIF